MKLGHLNGVFYFSFKFSFTLAYYMQLQGHHLDPISLTWEHSKSNIARIREDEHILIHDIGDPRNLGRRVRAYRKLTNGVLYKNREILNREEELQRLFIRDIDKFPLHIQKKYSRGYREQLREAIREHEALTGEATQLPKRKPSLTETIYMFHEERFNIKRETAKAIKVALQAFKR